MTKFNARQFTKYGFVHVAEEDFSDDGNRFQIWMHEESGLKVSYSRYTYTNNNFEKVTQYFISPRESYGSHGLLYEDVRDEPEFVNSEKFNGCFEVDMDELVELLEARHELFVRKAAEVAEQPLDMTEVRERAMFERNELMALMELAKTSIKWWELKEYALRNACRNMDILDRSIKKLDEILDGDINRYRQRQLITGFSKYGYIVDRLGEGSRYGYYNELMELVCA